MFNIIFPAHIGTRKIDPFWEKEFNAAANAGFSVGVITDQNESGSMRVTAHSGWKLNNQYLYRGWIVKPPYYQKMSELIIEGLVNNYTDYLWSFEFPNWYKIFTNHETPKSFIFTADEVVNLGLEEIAKQVKARVGNQSLIIKDYLKSRKHEWFDACFIKDASDISESIRIMSNFFKLQGRDFYGGLVFREFISLKKLGVHPKSNMPLPIEFRTFFLNQKPIITSMYWNNDIEYPNNVEFPPQDWLHAIGKKMHSPFVALDIAQSEDGKWWVIEVNDGGTAGYPDNLDTNKFYTLLYNELCNQ